MSKDQVHNWLRTAAVLAAIIFAGGGYAMKINDNSKGIERSILRDEKINERVTIVSDSVHAVELRQVNIEALSKATVDTLSEINLQLSDIRKEQGKQATIQAVNSQKLNSLTKDE